MNQRNQLSRNFLNSFSKTFNFYPCRMIILEEEKIRFVGFSPILSFPHRHAKPSTKAIIQDVKSGEMVDFNLGYETIRREK